MKGASKVIMGATLVMVATLAIVLALILVLLAELYCSLLLRRRRNQLKLPNTDTATAPTITESTTTSPLSSFYAQGVLHAPTDFLFPAATLPNMMAEKDNKLTFLHRVIELHGRESNMKPHRVGILFPTSPSTSIAASPSKAEETSVQGCSGSSGSGVEDLVYISNPVYDNEAAPDTPFETPDTSPSRLENSTGSSGEEKKKKKKEEEEEGCFGIYSPPPFTPPLSPMKKLPAQSVSVPLRDVGSLATSASDSNCNNGVSSSSSSSPCTSPSW